MRFASVRELKNQTSSVLRTAAGGTDVLVTSNGKPVAVIHGLNEEGLEDYVLGHHPSLRKSIEEAWTHYKKHGGTPIDKVLKNLERKRGKRRGKVRR